MSDVFILVCVNHRNSDSRPSCAARGGLELEEALRAQCGHEVKVKTYRCLGRCDHGPVARIGPGGPFFQGVTAADAARLVEEARRFAESLPRG